MQTDINRYTLLFWQIFMPVPAINHCICICVSLSIHWKSVNMILANHLWEFHQIYILRAVGEKDERIQLWGQKVKGQGYSDIKCGQISTLWEFRKLYILDAVGTKMNGLHFFKSKKSSSRRERIRTKITCWNVHLSRKASQVNSCYVLLRMIHLWRIIWCCVIHCGTVAFLENPWISSFSALTLLVGSFSP